MGSLEQKQTSTKFGDFASRISEDSPLNFMWLELTNTCNLECVHCYAGSSPQAVDHAPLSFEEYTNLISNAKNLGCSGLQFIGGEPTLNKYLPDLIEFASNTGFEHIEVFTNLISLPDPLLETFKKYKVHIATSVYSNNAGIHDAITKRLGSWDRTITNLKRIVSEGLPVRASIISMEENKGHADTTIAWLNSIGVTRVGIDGAREFGRAEKQKACDMGELCGQCAGGTLCVDPNGQVSPCIMSKAWGVWNVKNNTLDEIVHSDSLKNLRQQISQSVQERMGSCNPENATNCNPNDQGLCSPCSPYIHCEPKDCRPRN